MGLKINPLLLNSLFSIRKTKQWCQHFRIADNCAISIIKYPFSFGLPLGYCEESLTTNFSNRDQVFHTWGPSSLSASPISPAIDLPSFQPCRWPRYLPRYRACHRPFINTLSCLSSTFYQHAVYLAWLPSDPATQRGKKRLPDGSLRDHVDEARPHWLSLCSDFENTACFPHYCLSSPSLFRCFLAATLPP